MYPMPCQMFWYLYLVLGTALWAHLPPPSLPKQVSSATDYPRRQIKKLYLHRGALEHQTLLSAVSSHHSVLSSPCCPVNHGGREAKATEKTELTKSFLIGNSFEDWNFSSIKTEATESKHRKKLVPFCCHGHLCLTQHCPQSSTTSTASFSTVLRQKAGGASSPCPPQVKPEA